MKETNVLITSIGGYIPEKKPSKTTFSLNTFTKKNGVTKKSADY